MVVWLEGAHPAPQAGASEAPLNSTVNGRHGGGHSGCCPPGRPGLFSRPGESQALAHPSVSFEVCAGFPRSGGILLAAQDSLQPGPAVPLVQAPVSPERQGEGGHSDSRSPSDTQGRCAGGTELQFRTAGLCLEPWASLLSSPRRDSGLSCVQVPQGFRGEPGRADTVQGCDPTRLSPGRPPSYHRV